MKGCAFYLIIIAMIKAVLAAVQFSEKQAEILGIGKNLQLGSIKQKQFLGGPLFGFLDPLNLKSYESATKNAKKFDYICPKAFQIFTMYDSDKIMIRNIASSAPENIPTQGQFIVTLKKQNPSIKITPVMNFNLSQMKPEKVVDLFQNPQLLFPELKVHLQQYDGIVLDFGSFIHPATRPHLYHFLSYISRKFQDDLTAKKKKQVIVTAHIPKTQKVQQLIENLNTLAEFISYGQAKFSHFVLLAYDYNIQSHNSPIYWVENALKHFFNEEGILNSKNNDSYINPRIILAFPFFGKCYSENQKDKKGQRFRSQVELAAMKQNNQEIKFTWDSSAKEHFINTSRGLCEIPTKQFFRERIELAQKYQTGIGVEQLGDGFQQWLRIF